MADVTDTPLMQQYKEIKSRNRDAILFFRMGDFYEMFFEDAHLAARLLNITLTSRGDGVPLAGVPVKAAADYLRQLVAAGQRVAICEQVEDPRLARGIVRREVIETITPGAILDEGSLTGGEEQLSGCRWRGGGGAGGQWFGRTGGDRPEHWRVPARDAGAVVDRRGTWPTGTRRTGGPCGGDTIPPG